MTSHVDVFHLFLTPQASRVQQFAPGIVEEVELLVTPLSRNRRWRVVPRKRTS